MGALGVNTTGSDNVAVGRNALDANTTGHSGVAIGESALTSNTTGIRNVAIGQNCMATCTTGAENTAVGQNAANDITTGDGNVVMGQNAGATLTTGSNNTALGINALDACTTAANNVAVGSKSLTDCTTGSGNVAVGESSGENITTGANNICIGIDCGDTLTTGDTNILIGNTARPSASGGANQISMGVVVTCVGDNNFTFGNQGTDSNIAFGATSITAPSDIRLKEDIQDEEVGLNFINDLRPVTFLWKKEKDIPSHFDSYKEGSEERTMNGKHNHGFIAQEVKATIDAHNLKDGFEMWQENESDGRQRVAPAALMSVMVKAVQELSTQVDELKQELSALKGE